MGRDVRDNNQGGDGDGMDTSRQMTYNWTGQIHRKNTAADFFLQGDVPVSNSCPLELR